MVPNRLVDVVSDAAGNGRGSHGQLLPVITAAGARAAFVPTSALAAVISRHPCTRRASVLDPAVAHLTQSR
ncbi:MAG: hypothetical protein K0R87_3391, partial [Pseudonocardia sp.]|nr:hypothetical protein [Pseudonocardia sp.]